MEVVDGKALVFRTRSPSKYAVIPKHKVLSECDGVYEVAVYWGLDECRVLKNLGVRDVPAPITAQYDWPGRYKPMGHQIETAAFLTMYRRAFCFNDPGTGKTLSAIWAADYLMRKGLVRRVLILCPMSIMHSAWMGDIMQSVLHRTAVVCHHTQSSRRIEMIARGYEFVIVNYDGLGLIADTIKKDGTFDLVIVDEANAYKNTNTRRWKLLASILKPETYLWLMTGTPASQAPVDAYGLAKLVNPQGVPAFVTAWKDKVSFRLTPFKWVPKPDAREQVFAALQPAIRFTKAQCLDLPPVVTLVRDVPMSPQQVKYYKMLKEQLLVRAAGETVSAVNAGVAISKLLQISCGAAYTDGKEILEFDAAPRLRALEEVLEETDRKVLVFALFRSSIDRIVQHVRGCGYGVDYIHGDISAGRRGDIINNFQTKQDIRVLVLQPQATAHGITLTAADTVVFFGPLMSVEQYIQAISRADRKGQDAAKVTVVHIQSSPVERRLFSALQGKVDDNRLLTDLFAEEAAEK